MPKPVDVQDTTVCPKQAVWLLSPRLTVVSYIKSAEALMRMQSSRAKNC